MARAHAAVAVVCLALGSADVVYLNLAVAPALMADVTRRVSPADREETAARPLVASGEGAGARLPPEARAIDPELTARTGAEPEPEAEQSGLAGWAPRPAPGRLRRSSTTPSTTP